jgi:hypothetical protein
LSVRSAPRHARPRIATAAIAVGVLLCHAAAWVHSAATPHVTCFEHGERVHLDQAAHLHGPAAAPRADHDRLTVASVVAESAAHGPEHCGLFNHRSTSATTPPALSAHAQTEPAPAMPPAPTERASAQLLRLAPKTSPPGTPTV